MFSNINIKKEKYKGYLFDFDDNIVYTDTKIILNNPQGEREEVSSEFYRDIRHNSLWTHREDSFSYFRDKQGKTDYSFLNTVKKSVEDNKLAPSFHAFKECIINAHHFCIITARGHNAKNIKLAIKYLVLDSNLFSKEELEKTYYNIKKFSKIFDDKKFHKYKDIKNNILLYLNDCDYYPVSSIDFTKRFKLENDGSAATPEERKKTAIIDFVEKRISNALDIGIERNNISFGFSDDDKKNIIAAIDIKKILSFRYKEISFYIYDTSEKNIKTYHFKN